MIPRLDAFIATKWHNNTQYIYIYMTLLVICVFKPSKEQKSKTINARRKTRTALESALNSAHSYEEIF